MGTVALAAREVRLSRAGRSVLQRLTLELRAGQWTALVGVNGAGKSSLLAALAGVLPLQAGRVELSGRDSNDWPRRERARQLAWLAQQGDADGELAAIDIVRLGRLPWHGLWDQASAADEAAVRSAMTETDTLALAPRRLSALSGGERQRVLMARAYATQAPVLLLDEPAAHLDAPHQRALLQGLARRARDGACVVAALHDLTQALTADRVIALAEGRVVADGAPGERALHAALEDAFEGAFAIAALPVDGRPRWVAVPR